MQVEEAETTNCEAVLPEGYYETAEEATGKTLRRIVITVNNYSKEELDACRAFCTDECTWAICGLEIGKSGTPHIQAAMCLKKQWRFNALKKTAWGKRAYIFRMFGTPEQNQKYCSKGENYEEFGTLPSPGKRNDILSVVKRMQGGERLNALLFEAEAAVVFVKYSNGLTRLETNLRPRIPRSFLRVYWFHGPTGHGKSYVAEQFGIRKFAGRYWETSDTTGWFDSYCGQELAIFEDLRAKTFKFEFFLRLLDRYSLRVPIKGSYVEWEPKFIIVTCPKSPDNLFEFRGRQLPEDIRQLTRRINGGCFEFPRDRQLAWNTLVQDYSLSRKPQQPGGCPFPDLNFDEPAEEANASADPEILPSLEEPELIGSTPCSSNSTPPGTPDSPFSYFQANPHCYFQNLSTFSETPPYSSPEPSQEDRVEEESGSSSSGRIGFQEVETGPQPQTNNSGGNSESSFGPLSPIGMSGEWFDFSG